MATYETRIENLDERIRKLQAQKQTLRARHDKAERRARTHALCAFGGLLLTAYPNADWRAVDFRKLEALIEANLPAFAKTQAELLPTQLASRRLRDWEEESRATRRKAVD